MSRAVAGVVIRCLCWLGASPGLPYPDSACCGCGSQEGAGVGSPLQIGVWVEWCLGQVRGLRGGGRRGWCEEWSR
jgi:hypothetical protein